MIVVGSDGNVITEGRWGKPPGEADLVVDVPVSVVVTGVFADVRVSVDGVVDVVPLPAAGVVVAAVGAGAVADGGVVVTAGAVLSWASWTIPQTISPTRTVISRPQPTSAIGLRQPGTGSFGGPLLAMAADGIGGNPVNPAATRAAIDQQ